MDESKAYIVLVEILEENGLGWIAQQVDKQLVTGKIDEVKTLHKTIPGTRAVLYTPAERLSLLVDAIERSVIDSKEIGHEIGNFLEGIEIVHSITPKITFVQDEQEVLMLAQESFETESKSLFAELLDIREVRELLDELRVEEDDPEGQQRADHAC